MNYYNEHDPKAAAWLRQLIRDGLIPPGDVDERSIVDVHPADLAGYTQHHFFASIGGWSLALELAGWPANRPVRTGSCPCQPFSTAGRREAEADERHLWPHFRDLITFGEPTVTFGEQVASKLGRDWLSRVRTDLEGLGYDVGAADLCAASASPEVAGWIWIPDEIEPSGGMWIPVSAGPPHIRQRLFWVADPASLVSGRGEQRFQPVRGCHRRAAPIEECADGRMVHAEQPGLEGHPGNVDDGGESGRLDPQPDGSASAPSGACGIPHPGSDMGERRQHESERGPKGRTSDRRLNAWSNFDLIPCADGKARRIEPGLAPLAHGVPARVVRIRGYGNAIVPQVAAEFIRSYLESVT